MPRDVIGMRLDMEVGKTGGATIKGFSLTKSTLSFTGHRPRSALVVDSVVVRPAPAAEVTTQKETDLVRGKKKNARAVTRSGDATAAIRLSRPRRQDEPSQLMSSCVRLSTFWRRWTTGTRA